MEKLRRLKLILVAAAVILASASIANSTSTQSTETSISDPVSSTSETGLTADTTSLTEPETTKGDSSAAVTTSSSSPSSSITSTTTTTPAVTSASTTTPAVTSASTTTTPAVTSASTTTTTPAVTSASTTTTTPAVTSASTTTPAVTSASTTTTPAVTSTSTTTPAVTSASTTTTTPAVTPTPTTTTTTSNTPSYTADLQSTTQGTQFSGIDESSSLSTESTTTTTPKSTLTPGERGTLPLNIWNQLRISLSVKLLNTSQSRDEIRDGLIIPSFGGCPAYLFSTVDEPTVSANQGDPIFTFHVTYDAKPLIFTKSATVENVTSCMNSSLQEWKQSVLAYDGFNFDVDYLDTVTLPGLDDESDRMGQLVSNPCTIRHVCPNECYSCSQTLLECSFNFTCSGAREHSTCMLDDVGKPYCGCPYRYVEFGGKCVHQKDKLSLLLGSVGGGILGFCILLSGFCIVSVTWGKSTSMATRTYLSTMPQESNAFEPHNCKKTKTSIDDPGFYNVAFSTKEETLKRDISSGVRLRVADLDDNKSNYSTYQDRGTNLHPYTTMTEQESKGNVYSTSSSGGIKVEATDPIAKEEAREEISTF